MPEVNGNKVPFLEAIAAAESLNVVLPEVYYGELQGIARQLAFSIAGVASFDQLQAAKDSLTKALKEGQTFAQWQKNIDVKALELPKYRLDNIFRTNLQCQYMAGKWEQFERHQDSRPYLMYDAINDARVRPTHLALDGIIRAINDVFWKTHSCPNGYRCRCNLISLTEKQAQARSGNGKGLNKPIDEQKMKPDAGWDYSPRDRLHGINQAIDKRIEKGGVLADSLKTLLSSQAEKTGMTNMIVENLSYEAALKQVKESVNSTEFVEFYHNQNTIDNFIVGMLSDADKLLLATDARVVLLSKESLEHHKLKHPEVVLADYQNLPEIIESGEIYQTQQRRYVLLKANGKTYRAAMKVTQNGKEVYLLSLVAQSDSKATKEIRSKFEKIR